MNEKQVYENQDTAIKLLNENVDLKKRIKEAIKYINKMTENDLNDIEYNGEHYLVCGSDFDEGAFIILDILQGSDKNE